MQVSKSMDDDLIKVENTLVPLCDEFQYLGAMIEQNGGFGLDIINMISAWW